MPHKQQSSVHWNLFLFSWGSFWLENKTEYTHIFSDVHQQPIPPGLMWLCNIYVYNLTLKWGQEGGLRRTEHILQ
jgi:hypothetical protein